MSSSEPMSGELGLSQSTLSVIRKAAMAAPLLDGEQLHQLIRAVCELAYAEGAARAVAMTAAGMQALAALDRAKAA